MTETTGTACEILNAALAADHLASADCNGTQSVEARTLSTLQGIGYAILALHYRMADRPGSVPARAKARRGWRPRRRRAGTPAPDSDPRPCANCLIARGRLRTIGAPEAVVVTVRCPDHREDPEAVQAAADADVITALTGLWSAGGWRRLEVSRADDGDAGYCVPVAGGKVQTADALADPAAYPVIGELAELLAWSGWRRLEILGNPAHNQPYGQCEREDGSVVSLAEILEHPPGVPGITVPRYAAPRVSVIPVTDVISPEPVDKDRGVGHYQQVLLDTRTGELRFHENSGHREPWNPAWKSTRDVPRETWNRWYPGEPFSPGGCHAWEPVPGLLSWVIDSGVREFPYLDADGATALLEELAPYAQALLDGLFETAGDLDWSAASVTAGRNICGLCSRRRTAPGRIAGLADYSDIIARFPYLFRPELTGLPDGDLAGKCETITRFLGCNEHWNPEVSEAFGVPSRDGTIKWLTTFGVRSWYRVAAGSTTEACS